MDVVVIASGSKGNAYLIYDGKTFLLLDAGVSIKKLRVGCYFHLGEVSGCLVTHYHGDHSKAVNDLLKASVPVWMPEGEIEELKLEKHHRLHKLEKDEEGRYLQIQIGTMTVLPFSTEHDTPEPVGYLVLSSATGEKLLYFTDTFFLKWKFVGVTHIIGEVNYDSETMWEKVNDGYTPPARAKRLFQSHMSLEHFLDFLKANDFSKLKQIYICHISSDHGNQERIREAVQRATGAEVYICKEGGGIYDVPSNPNRVGKTSKTQKACESNSMFKP